MYVGKMTQIFTTQDGEFMQLSKLTSALLLALAAPSAMASGFALIEQSASGQGLSYAGSAVNTEDSSVMWFNPAGLTEINGNQAIVGGHVILPKADFTNDGSLIFVDTPGEQENFGGDANGATAGFVPNIYWKGDYQDYSVGLGINVPFGQHISYDENWVGRYHATETDLKTLNINPSIARKVNDKLSLGFGLNAQYVDVVLEQKVNQLALGSMDGNAKVTGSSWAFGYNLGLLYKASEDLNIGLSYRSKITHDVDGKVRYGNINNTTDLGALNPAYAGLTVADILYNADASATVNLPASASLAADYKISDKTQLLASATWTGWSAYDELVVEFDNGSPDSESNQNFDDSMRYALGVSHQLNSKVKLRTGVALDQTPVPNSESRSPRTPDNDRKWVSVGLGYKANKNLNVDIAYSYIFANESNVDYMTYSSLGDSLLKGSYDSSVEIFSAQVVWKY